MRALERGMGAYGACALAGAHAGLSGCTYSAFEHARVGSVAPGHASAHTALWYAARTGAVSGVLLAPARRSCSACLCRSRSSRRCKQSAPRPGGSSSRLRVRRAPMCARMPCWGAQARTRRRVSKHVRALTAPYVPPFRPKAQAGGGAGGAEGEGGGARQQAGAPHGLQGGLCGLAPAHAPGMWNTTSRLLHPCQAHAGHCGAVDHGVLCP